MPVEHPALEDAPPAPGKQRGHPGAAANHWTQTSANGSAQLQPPTDPSAGRLLLLPRSEAEPVREFVLDGRNITIGRAPACTVSLPDDQVVSRLHAVLHFDADHYTISDLGSSNGTLVNGVAIQAVTSLAEGDRITVGQHVLVFTRVPGSVAAPPPAEGAVAMPSPQGPPSLPPMPEVPDWEALLAQNDGAQASERFGEAIATGPAAVPDAERHAEEAIAIVGSVAPGVAPMTDAASASRPGEEAVATSPANMNGVPALQTGGQTVEEGPRTGQLEALRAQIVETSTVLARWTETTAQRTRRLRTELADVAGIVSAALIAATGVSSEAQGVEGALRRLEDIIQAAEHAANDPHHVDALVALAGRSNDLVTVLRIQQHLIEQLVLLRDHLDAMARQEGW